MGKTIIISSHILHELAELCNTVGIIEQGQLIFSGSGRARSCRRASMGQVVHIIGGRAHRARGAAPRAGATGITQIDVTQHNGQPRIDVTIDPESGLLDRRAAEPTDRAGVPHLQSIQQEQVNLETAFMRLTKGLVS